MNDLQKYYKLGVTLNENGNMEIVSIRSRAKDKKPGNYYVVDKPINNR